MSATMSYPLAERIGDPRLLVGREKEFADYGKWIAGIPRRISKSRAIVARKKSGKSAFVQRLYNQLWSENGSVIPFYFEVREAKVWLPDLARSYFESFASQLISFWARDSRLVMREMRLEKIKKYSAENSLNILSYHVEAMERAFRNGFYCSMWQRAINAPQCVALEHGVGVLVIIDDFHYLSNCVCTNQQLTVVDDTIPGSFSGISESAWAPMLATGTEIGWNIQLMDMTVEIGRIPKFFFQPFHTTATLEAC